MQLSQAVLRRQVEDLVIETTKVALNYNKY